MYLGIDLGTSSIKAVLTQDGQQILAQASQPLTVNRPQPLWSEQDPADWWTALLAVMQQLKTKHSALLAKVTAIGLSGQQHGAVLLDQKGHVLRPAILWNDGRSYRQCEQIMQRVPEYATLTGNTVMPGFTAPKLLWVAEHEPEIFAKVDKVLLPKDYLRYRMSGVFATDMSDASGTAWLNVAKREWSDEMLHATKLTLAHMPELFEGSSATATVSVDLANTWGISNKVIIAGGAGDNAAAAISMNVINPGSAFLSLGTSGTYFVSESSFSPNAAGGVHTFCHCLPNLWHQMNCHLSAASCLTWWADICHETDVEKLVAEAEQQAYLNTDVLFLPYLSGERSPHGNPHAKSVFLGMSHTTTRAQFTEAVLEGVAFNFAEGQKAMLETGTHIDNIAVVGGGARSVYWGKILATALNRSLVYYQDREVGAALGAARLAYLAVNKVAPATAFATAAIECVAKPDPEQREAFAQRQIKFESLYQQVKNLFN